MLRRDFLHGICTIAAGRLAAGSGPTLLLCSGWQTVNIGDIAHTPGVLALLERHLPGVELILWPNAIDRGVEPMLRKRFPRLRIVQGHVGPDGGPDNSELRDAFRAAGIFIHGSGPSVVAQAQVQAWRKTTRKPYGFFGIGLTLQSEAAAPALNENLRSLLDGSAFLFTRETASLANARKAEIKGPELGFVPDGAFSMDIVDEPRAEAFLRDNGLEPERFICAIPRLRYTPYQMIRKVNWSEEEIRRRTVLNDRFAEADHAKLREAVVAWVRKTGGKVLLCPEMTYQLDIIDPLLYDPLPDDVKPKVVRRKTYWLPDEASSVYKRSAAIISMECHSPILAAAQGTPCMYLHQPEDGIKGQMWKDVGLGEWYFDIDQAGGDALAQCVLGIHARKLASRKKVEAAVSYARKVQAERASLIRNKLQTGV